MTAGFARRSASAPSEKIAGFVHIGRPNMVSEDRPRPALADDRFPVLANDPAASIARRAPLFYETRQRDKSLLPRDPFKAIVAPRPIGWISTRSRDGLVNLAPYSFFNAFSSTPPIVGFSSEGAKDFGGFRAGTAASSSSIWRPWICCIR